MCFVNKWEKTSSTTLLEMSSIVNGCKLEVSDETALLYKYPFLYYLEINTWSIENNFKCTEGKKNTAKWLCSRSVYGYCLRFIMNILQVSLSWCETKWHRSKQYGKTILLNVNQIVLMTYERRILISPDWTVEREQPFSPPLCSWFIIGLWSASH